MKKVATALEMQAIDRYAIQECGIPAVALMENAGAGVARLVLEKFPGLRGGRALVFAGPGNNGGDGFVAARHLLNRGVDVRVFLLGKKARLKNEAQINAAAAAAIDIPITELDERNLKSIGHDLRHSHVIIDAIFGTGLKEAPRGLSADVIRMINNAGKPVLSIDIPSGLASDTGRAPEPHVKAAFTAALALFKRAHLLYPAAAAAGEITLLDIGIPVKAAASQRIAVQRVEAGDARAFFPPRRVDAHKGNYGHALVIAGSRGKGGAAGLTALAALRAGAGLVTLAAPQSCVQALEFNPLEAMTAAVAETADGTMSRAGLDALVQQAAGKNAVAVGPGMGAGPETAHLLAELLPRISCPLVIDADGLNCLAMLPAALASLKGKAILTPHPKEMARLCGRELPHVLDNRLETALEFAAAHSVYVVLKGAGSIIATPDGDAYINSTGNPGMATAGSGDVLTGIIAGLLAQGFDLINAAIAGTYVHGLAGDLHIRERSPQGLIASDLLTSLPLAIRELSI